MEKEQIVVGGYGSVRLTPGLTNLLAQYVYTCLDYIDQLELSVLLRLGEHHGQAAIE